MNQPNNSVKAFLGLGGNVGDVRATMKSAIALLGSRQGISVTRVSPLYKTPPWGIEDQDWFLNCCVEIQANISAHDLLSICLEVERAHKRERRDRWGPRTIDIDVILFGDQHIETETLTVPHPRLHERLFVLQPLIDIAPDLVVAGKSVERMIAALEEPLMVPIESSGDWWSD